MFKLFKYIRSLIKLSNQKFNDQRAISQRQKMIQQNMNSQSSALHALRVGSNTALQYIERSDGKLESAKVYIDHSVADKLGEIEVALGCKFAFLNSQDGIDVYLLKPVEQEL